MLFGPCTIDAGATFLPGAGTLCAGSAGFVSAVVGAMLAQQKAEAAPVLRGKVPEADWLGVRVVTDNIVIQFVPGERRDGFAAERAAGNTRPDQPPRTALRGKWGLAMHCESRRGDETRNVMIDFGYTPEVLLNNMEILDVDPARIDAMVLSHGHYDHFGGMVGFLNAHGKALKKRLPFNVGGEDCFCLRRNAGGNFGSLDRKAIVDSNISLMMASEPALIADHGFTTGRIGQTSFEQPLQPTKEIVGIFDGFGCFPEAIPAEKNTGDYITDDFEHEIVTSYMIKGKGLVVLTSCSHRGVINAVRQAMKAADTDRVHAVLGGFHIVPPLGDDYINRAIEEFRAIDPDHLIVGHCTGNRFYDLARVALGDRVIHSAVGTRFVFSA